MTVLIIIIGVILAALLIGAFIWVESIKSDEDAYQWVIRNFIDKDIL